MSEVIHLICLEIEVLFIVLQSLFIGLILFLFK